ncbi:MAG: EAL domain-containing protein [Actinobacteria bacterium]|nr:EAL domain-containing protein [Actinomycetota bacterium]
MRPAIYGLLLAAVASYLTVVWLAGPPARGVVASAGLTLGHGACGLALVLGHRRTPPGLRRVWRMCGASALLSAGIFGCWTYYAVRYDELPPVLSLADVFFVGSVVLLLFAALLWPGNATRRRERRRYLVDGAVLAGSLLLLAWSLVIRPNPGGPGDGSWQTAVALLYPALDVLAVAAGVYALGAAASGTQKAARFLLCAVIVLAVGDANYALQVSTGTWNYDLTTMTLWLLAFCLLVAGRFAGPSTTPLPVRVADLRASRTSVIAPVVPVFVAILLAVATPSDVVTIVLVAAVLVLVLVRYTLLGLADRSVVEGLQSDVLADSAFLAVTLQHLADPILACDANGRVRFFNAALAQQRPELRVGAHMSSVGSVDEIFRGDGLTPWQQEELPMTRALRGDTVIDEVAVIGCGANRRTFHLSARPILGAADELLGAVLLKHDITAERATKGDLLRRALTDELTGLGNRAQLRQDLHTTGAGSLGGGSCALLLLDLDDFKRVNDSLGHRHGDLLLFEIATRIRAVLRPGERAIRLGGDEFVVFLEPADAAEATATAKRLLLALEAPVRVAGTELTISASLGIAMGHTQGDLDSLLGAADVAMYMAKKRGKGMAVTFEPYMQQAAQDRLSLDSDLRRAVRNNQLHLVYQPIVSLKTGALAGVEALVRWHDDARGDVSPVDFIPVAEDSGLILALGEWVLRSAAAQLQRWNEQAPGMPLVLSVNVSTRQLERPGLLAVVDDLLAHGLDPACLVLEITETALSLDDSVAAQTLQSLSDRRIALAVDDFGTGYSSLTRLRDAPLSRLKIDRSFVSEISHAGSHVPIIDATLTMAYGLGLSVTAEGIETAEQLHYLRGVGCDYAQGYLFARPLSAQSISDLLRGHVSWSGLIGEGRHADPLLELTGPLDPPAVADPAPSSQSWEDARAAAVALAEAVAATAADEVTAEAARTARIAVDVASVAAFRASVKADQVAALAAAAVTLSAAPAAPSIPGPEAGDDPPAGLPFPSKGIPLRGELPARHVDEVTATQQAVVRAASVAAAAAAAKIAVRVAAVATAAATAALEAAAVIGEQLAQDATQAAAVVAASTASPEDTDLQSQDRRWRQR